MKSGRKMFSVWTVLSFLLVFPAVSHAQEELPFTGSRYDYFGVSVSVSGNYAIAGADGDSQSAGAAYAYERGGDSWVQRQKLTASERASADNFGASVSVSGGYAAIGAKGDDEKGSNAGAVYVFRNSGGLWTEHGKLLPQDGAANDSFGMSVGISGTYVIAGSPYDDDRGSQSGAAYIFELDGSEWVQTVKLIPDDGATGDYFGSAVAISGKYAIVGAHVSKDPITNTSFGAAYVFERESSVTGGVWRQKAKLTADDGAKDDGFGRSVSIYTATSGTYALVGANGDDDMGSAAGAAYVFRLESGVWNQKAKLTASDGAAGDGFGGAVSLYGDSSGWRAVVGGEKNDGAGTNAGAAYTFELSGSDWEQTGRRIPGGAAPDGALFGKSVAISGDYLLVGAPGSQDSTGAVYANFGGSCAPTIGTIPDQFTSQSVSVSVAFTVSDCETSASLLDVSAVSRNTTVVPQSGLSLGGSGGNRTLTVRPSNQKGTATIEVTVADADGNRTPTTFVLTVTEPNDPPVITGLPERVEAVEDTPVTLEFRVSDDSTSAASLVLSGLSSDTGIVSDIVFGGSGENRTVTVTGRGSGSVEITVTLTDSRGARTSETFILAVKGPPSISLIQDQITEEDKTKIVNFGISDPETAAELEASGMSPEDAETTAANRLALYTQWYSLTMSEGSIEKGGSGTSRKLTIVPPRDEFGEAEITVTAINDGGFVATRTFSLQVTPVNDAPMLLDFANQTGNEGEEIVINFDVGDVDTALSRVSVSAVSEDVDVYAKPTNIGDAPPTSSALIPSDDRHIFTQGTGSERKLVLRPVAGKYGITEITVTANDGNGEDNYCCTEKTFRVTVNAAPMISDIGDQLTNEDETAEVPFEVGDPDGSASALTVSASSDNPDLIARVEVTGSGQSRRLIITPAKDQFGKAEITVTVIDEKDAFAQASFFIDVESVNDAPTISSIGPQQGWEDNWTEEIPFTVRDAEGGLLTVTVTPENTTMIPRDGSHIRINGFATVDYSVGAGGGTPLPMNVKLLPGANQTGTTMITVAVRDEANAETTARFMLTLNNENDPPIIEPITNPEPIDEDGTATVEFSVTDGDNSDSELLVSIESDNIDLVNPGDGTTFELSPISGGGGTLTLTPPENAFGRARITVRVSDGIASDDASFTFTVNSVNDSPEIVIDTSLEMEEDPLSASTFFFTVSDPDTPLTNLTAEATSLTVEKIPVGDAYLSVSGSGASRTLRVKPAKDAFGLAKIRITVDDNEGDAGTSVIEKTVFLTIIGKNDPPTISVSEADRADDPYGYGRETYTVIKEGDLYTFIPEADDPDNDPLRFTIVNKPIWADFDENTGELSGIPEQNHVGTSTGVSIRVSDPDGETASLRAFEIKVVNDNDRPTISDISNQTTDEDTTTGPILFTVGDVETGELLISATSDNPTLVPNSAMDIGGVGPETAVSVTTSGEGVDLTMTITPEPDQTGTAKITLTVTDTDPDDPKSVTEVFYLVVRPSNDPPDIYSEVPIAEGSSDMREIDGIRNQTADADQVVLVDFLIRDPDGGNLTLTAVSEEPQPDETDMLQLPAENIRIVGANSDGSISLTPGVPVPLQVEILPVEGPIDGYTSRIIVRADDGTTQDEVSFLLSVNYINKAPVIGDIASQTTDEDTPKEIIFSVSDAEGGSLLIRVESEMVDVVPNDPEHINLEDFGPDYVLPLPADGSQYVKLKLTPAFNMNGPTWVTVKVEDGDAFSGDNAITERFLFTVRPVNDPPYVERIAAQSTSEGAAVEDIPLQISDAEGGSLTITVVSENEELIPSNADHITIKTASGPGLGFGTSYTFSATAGTANNFFLTVTPLEDMTGSADITVTVDDNTGAATATSTRTFRVNVDVVNKSPEIVIQPPGTREVTTGEETPKEIPVMLSDADYDDLLISVESSNTALVPNDGDHILINGDGLNPGFNLIMMDISPQQIPLVITPEENMTGRTTITMSAEDGVNPAVEIAFVLRVTEVNDPPEFPDAILTQVITEEIESNPISFKVSDPEGGRLTLTAISSNTTLLPIDDDHINIAGFGAEYETVTAAGETASLSLTLTPEMILTANDSETVEITLQAEDEDGAVGERKFTVKVKKENRPPTITGFYYEGPLQEGMPLSDIVFSVRDSEGGRMELSVISSNTDLFPTDFNYIKIEGIGPDYVLDIEDTDTDIPLRLSLTPFGNEFGPATITLTVKDVDGDHEVTEDIQINIQPVADAPIISAIPRQATDRGVPKDISFTVADAEGGEIVISVSSSNTELLPSSYPYVDLNNGYGNSIIVPVVSGGSASLSLKLSPIPGRFGSTDITVHAEDPEGGESSKTFTLDVDVENILPGLDMSGIESQITDEDTPITVSFTITDAEGGGLPISVTSSNTTLLPGDDAHINIIDDAMVFGATYIAVLTADVPETFDLKLTPAANETGSTKITVTVGDTGGEVSEEFILRVNPVNDPPIISDIGNQETLPNTPIDGDVAFSVTDMEGGQFEGGMVEVSVESKDPTLVPNDVDHLRLIGPDGQTFGIVHKFVALSGQPVNLKLRVTPTDASGELPITIKVNDGSGEIFTATAEETFSLKIGESDGINTKPVISGNANWKMTEDDDVEMNIVFTVTDREGGDMIVSAASSVDALLPNDSAHMNIEGFGNTYVLSMDPNASKELRLKVTPAPDQNGQTVISVTVQDGDQTVAKNFYLLVEPENDLPYISGISDKTTPMSTPLNVPFTISDKETPVDSLVVKVESSSDAFVVPITNIAISGSGNSRTLEITPVANRTGETTIVVSVDDGVAKVEEGFKLTVKDSNTPPVIQSIPSPQSTPESVRAEIDFTATDAETPARNLIVTAVSRNQSVVPDGNIEPAIYLGDAATPNYRLLITPVNGQTGSVPINVSVDDGTEVTESTFTLMVVPGDANPPDISDIFTPRFTNEDETKVIKFHVSDDETPAMSLNVYVYSENQALVPDDNLRLKFLGSTAEPNYELTMIPVPDAKGDVRITVVADDGDAPSSAVFTLKIISINDAPEIYDMTINDGDTSVTAEFKVRDVETLPENVDIRVSSSNTLLLPVANIAQICGDNSVLAWCGEGEYCCRVVAVASPGRSGSSLVTVEADDGSGVVNSVTEDSFYLTVGFVLPGDVDGNGALELKDAILALRVMAGIRTSVNLDADVNGDDLIGAAEAVYVLRDISR